MRLLSSLVILLAHATSCAAYYPQFGAALHQSPHAVPLPCGHFASGAGRATKICAAADNSRSVGDVVKGVHGGKYQFSTNSFESFAGGEFASALYASSNAADKTSDDAPWPKWATEFRRNKPPDAEVLELGADGAARLRVTNIYRSWDRFYASFLDEADGFEVTPTNGDLAPRGDVNAPYRALVGSIKKTGLRLLYDDDNHCFAYRFLFLLSVCSRFVALLRPICSAPLSSADCCRLPRKTHCCLSYCWKPARLA